MGLFSGIGNLIKDGTNNYMNKRKEAYEKVQEEKWYYIYEKLKYENMPTAKANGLLWALSEKLEKEEDTEFMKQMYEREKKCSAEKTNSYGFMCLKKEMEKRNLI